MEFFMTNDLLSRVRRNHALEHATINVLSNKHKGFSAQGNSTPGGFNLNIFGEIAEEEVADAVEEAYKRLKNGDHELALHPNCGTVLLTTAILAALAAQATFSLERRRQRRPQYNIPILIAALPVTILAVFITLIASKPLGMVIQANYTVEPELGDLQVTSIRKVSPHIMTRIFQFLLGQARNQEVHAFRIETIR
jgi:S-ribosylhomocysteine lyase LuxS involved in autoinducer biosynthesis